MQLKTTFYFAGNCAGLREISVEDPQEIDEIGAENLMELQDLFFSVKEHCG